MSNILNKYIKKSILSNIIIIFLILISVSSTIKLFDELRNFDKKNYFIFEIFFCTILSLPKEFDLFLPIATLLGGLLGLSILETRNELIIIQIAGFSKIQIASSVIKASAVIFICNIISNEWILPYSHTLICAYKNNKQYNTYLFPEKNKNWWLTDNNNFIFIKKIVTTQELIGINIYFFTQNRELHKILYIERAVYNNQHWSLLNISELDFSEKQCIIKKNILCQQWDTLLTPKLLSMMMIHPRVLSISNLKYCIQYFNKVGQNSTYYQLFFWNKILSPIFGILMIITALLCNWGPFHQKKTVTKLFLGSIIGFLFYILHQIFGIFSMIYHINPVIGAISSIMLLIIFDIIMLWRYF